MFRAYLFLQNIKIASLHWFKNYVNFAQWVNFAYLWSCIGKGLRLHLGSRFVSEIGLLSFFGKTDENDPSFAPPTVHYSEKVRVGDT